MNQRTKDAIREWDNEVEAETVELIERGTPPFEAVERARNTVSRRRRDKAIERKRGAARKERE